MGDAPPPPPPYVAPAPVQAPAPAPAPPAPPPPAPAYPVAPYPAAQYPVAPYPAPYAQPYGLAVQTPPGYHTHDGVFVRLYLGFGGTKMESDAATISGTGGGLGIALGGALTPNLIL